MPFNTVSSREKERAACQVGLFFHVMFYLLVNTVLVYIYLTGYGEKYWIAWPVIGWGMGLYMHARSVLAFAAGPLKPETSA